ncbi:MAG: agmatine deiminase [Bryobacteraceae bacterium]|nr:MAG: agmatine deiminase [Bryobacteraceae bacterium]
MTPLYQKTAPTAIIDNTTMGLDPTRVTPAEAGFSMPAEWAPHAATWLAWPQNEDDFPGKLEAVRWALADWVAKLTRGERVRLVTGSARAEQQARAWLARAGASLRRVDFLRHPLDRGWMRDCGPIFVTRSGPAPRRAIVHMHFNGWAKYDNWRRDHRIPQAAAARLRVPLFRARWNGRPFVCEGGGIEGNGLGTLLSTEECYLDPRTQVRNPGFTRTDTEAAWRAFLGVKNVFWLGRGIAGDDTHGHIDDLCRFVGPRTLVLVREDNPRDANHRPLRENWERIADLRLEDGSKPEVVPLPMPAPVFFDGQRLPASYANFYIANHAVFVPTFNDPNDRVALGILGELFRDRPVVGIHALDLVWGLGTLHCLSQQEPA